MGFSSMRDLLAAWINSLDSSGCSASGHPNIWCDPPVSRMLFFRMHSRWKDDRGRGHNGNPSWL